jgi:hypothetical protein
LLLSFGFGLFQVRSNPLKQKKSNRCLAHIHPPDSKFAKKQPHFLSQRLELYWISLGHNYRASLEIVKNICQWGHACPSGKTTNIAFKTLPTEAEKAREQMENSLLQLKGPSASDSVSLSQSGVDIGLLLPMPDSDGDSNADSRFSSRFERRIC